MHVTPALVCCDLFKRLVELSLRRAEVRVTYHEVADVTQLPVGGEAARQAGDHRRQGEGHTAESDWPTAYMCSALQSLWVT